jgi:hypothetical protein
MKCCKFVMQKNVLGRIRVRTWLYIENMTLNGWKTP